MSIKCNNGKENNIANSFNIRLSALLLYLHTKYNVGEVKVKLSAILNVEALRHVMARVDGGIAPAFLTSALDGGVGFVHFTGVCIAAGEETTTKCLRCRCLLHYEEYTWNSNLNHCNYVLVVNLLSEC
jgi:hypothetical protein